MSVRKNSLALVFTLIASTSVADVTQFRGSNGDGILTGTAAPWKFSESENVAWKTAVPGKGWSSPVAVDGKIWLTTAVEVFPTEEERKAMILQQRSETKFLSELAIAKSITLKLIQIDLKSGVLETAIDLSEVAKPNPIHKTNSYASPTPVIDGGHVYCHFGTYGTFCIDRRSLKVVWERRIPLQHSVGPGSSPFIHKNALILICDGLESQYVTALDKSNGETLWKTDRPAMDTDNGEFKKSFDTPVAIVDQQGREQLICMGAQWLVAYDPQTGDEIWRLRHGKGFSVVPRPVIGHGMVYISTGFGKAQLWAVRLDGSGDVTDTHVIWREKRNIPTSPSPLLIDDRIYIISDRGIATCFDAIDGTTVWTERVGGNYSASPLFVDGKIFFASEDGRVTVIKPGDEFQQVAKNQLAGQIMASPIALNDALIIRTETSLYRFEELQGDSAGKQKVSQLDP